LFVILRSLQNEIHYRLRPYVPRLWRQATHIQMGVLTNYGKASACR
jgi:hypothetical protein